MVGCPAAGRPPEPRPSQSRRRNRLLGALGARSSRRNGDPEPRRPMFSERIGFANLAELEALGEMGFPNRVDPMFPERNDFANLAGLEAPGEMGIPKSSELEYPGEIGFPNVFGLLFPGKRGNPNLIDHFFPETTGPRARAYGPPCRDARPQRLPHTPNPARRNKDGRPNRSRGERIRSLRKKKARGEPSHVLTGMPAFRANQPIVAGGRRIAHGRERIRNRSVEGPGSRYRPQPKMGVTPRVHNGSHVKTRGFL